MGGPNDLSGAKIMYCLWIQAARGEGQLPCQLRLSQGNMKLGTLWIPQQTRQLLYPCGVKHSSLELLNYNSCSKKVFAIRFQPQAKLYRCRLQLIKLVPSNCEISLVKSRSRKKTWVCDSSSHVAYKLSTWTLIHTPMKHEPIELGSLLQYTGDKSGLQEKDPTLSATEHNTLQAYSASPVPSKTVLNRVIDWGVQHGNASG